jgi:hypothetical protein
MKGITSGIALQDVAGSDGGSYRANKSYAPDDIMQGELQRGLYTIFVRLRRTHRLHAPHYVTCGLQCAFVRMFGDAYPTLHNKRKDGFCHASSLRFTYHQCLNFPRQSRDLTSPTITFNQRIEWSHHNMQSIDQPLNGKILLVTGGASGIYSCTSDLSTKKLISKQESASHSPNKPTPSAQKSS